MRENTPSPDPEDEFKELGSFPADAEESLDAEMVTYSGMVERRPWGGASKSRHEAVVLVTDDSVVKLRRPGGHAFHDPELEKLVGKRVSCQGEVKNGVLFIEGGTLQVINQKH